MHREDTDIYILGAGIDTPRHLTLETVSALRRSKIVYAIRPLSEDVLRALDITAEMRSLWPLYEASVGRPETYQLVANTILDATNRERPVAFLTPGNPAVFDSVAQHILSSGPARGLRIHLMPAVSSIDTVIADVGYDLAPGIQIYDASWFVATATEPCIYTACLLLQLNAFGTSFSTIGRRMRTGALERLCNHLLRFYPAEHPLYFIQSATRTRSRDTRQMRLCDLRNLHGTVPTSLYIPRAKEPVVDPEFRALMNDRDFFEAAYEVAPQ